MLQHLFHGDPGTDVPEINEGFLGHGIFSFRGSKCGSGIEPRLTGNDTMPDWVGGVDMQRVAGGGCVTSHHVRRSVSVQLVWTDVSQQK